MLEPRIEKDNVININEETLSIISERHRNIILSFKKVSFYNNYFYQFYLV